METEPDVSSSDRNGVMMERGSAQTEGDRGVQGRRVKLFHSAPNPRPTRSSLSLLRLHNTGTLFTSLSLSST